MQELSAETGTGNGTDNSPAYDCLLPTDAPQQMTDTNTRAHMFTDDYYC